ncbi:hypothetical protein OG233_17545 [Streptomyces sp. NBC_01218]|uniref:scabin-related ADP-ribosyltransferase n=1 Tax=unclassified Streptomyces TaxID=2593676 RepID=UPI002E156D26|nr:hypothetical protein OG233_17545 [Streptomyces sp. NBC_01218]
MFKTALRIASAACFVVTSLTFASSANADTDPLPGTPEQVRDTGPCGPTGGYRSSDWERTTTNRALRAQVDTTAISEGWYWRHDDNTLWRGDTRPDPRAIFRSGFTPLGTDLTPLSKWIIGGGGQNTAHLSTSCDRWVAQGFATGGGKNGWVYAIQAPGGIDVNATARMTGIQSQYLWNKEIDFPGGIQGRFIEGACQYHWAGQNPQTNVDVYENLGCVTNPDFRPVEHSGETATGTAPAPAGTTAAPAPAGTTSTAPANALSPVPTGAVSLTPSGAFSLSAK